MENRLYISSEHLIKLVCDWWDNKISKEEINNAFYSYLNNDKAYRTQERNRVCSSIIKTVFSKNEIKDYYYIMSALFRVTMIPDILYEILRSCIEDENLSKEMKRFIYGQCCSYLFLYPDINNSQSRELMDDLYEIIYQDFLKDLADLAVWIPVTQRNHDLVIVFASQILSMNHGPTKTLLDRCYTIETMSNQKVYIINTSDALTPFGIIDWFDISIGNHIPELDSKPITLTYGDRSFQLFQCPQKMPNVSIIRDIMKIILEEKPEYIVTIGDSNITADICSKIVPVLTVTLGPSERAQTRATFQMTGHKINDEDRRWLDKHHFPESHIIEGLFTSSFKPQTHIFSRNDLGLENDWFVCIIVGARLYTEVTEDFLKVVSKLAQNNIYCVFMGDFNNYNLLINNDALLTRYTRYLGFQDDAMAIYDCCDIYLNPTRSGGGTSAAEALYKGLPVITTNYGDVAVGVGDDFIVNDYGEMLERTINLANNKEYYNEQSKKAKERALLLTDSEHEFVRIIEEMRSRPGFK